MTNKFKVGDRAKMTETTGGYDFSEDAITGYVTVYAIFNSHVYLCTVEGYDDDVPLCFYEDELLPIEEGKEKEEEQPKKPIYKVGDVVKMNDKQPYCFNGFDVDGTMTVKQINGELYLCEVNGYNDVLWLNFREEWIDGYADKSFKPGDIVTIHGDEEEGTGFLDGKRGIVIQVDEEDSFVAIYNEHHNDIDQWWCWNKNLTKS